MPSRKYGVRPEACCAVPGGDPMSVPAGGSAVIPGTLANPPDSMMTGHPYGLPCVGMFGRVRQDETTVHALCTMAVMGWILHRIADLNTQHERPNGVTG